MRLAKITRLDSDNNAIEFEDGYKLFSFHETDCCERHWMDVGILTMEDVEGLVFKLDGDLVRPIKYYGLELIPTNGYPVKIPCYSENNGYYSNDLTVILKDPRGNTLYEWNLTDYQVPYCYENENFHREEKKRERIKRQKWTETK